LYLRNAIIFQISRERRTALAEQEKSRSQHAALQLLSSVDRGQSLPLQIEYLIATRFEQKLF
jgi:hypothetical protein